jgi:intracellular sulfur oxidation DsrE/DsrF family protein
MEESGSPMIRRSFLSSAALGVAAFGQSVIPARWQPTRHAQDDWLDKIPGQHRLVFDTTEPGGMSSALLYATNFYTANQSDYGLQNSDLAVVIVARHVSTPFAYNEAIWTKYGVQLSSFIDKNKEPSKTNAYARQLNGAIGRGVQLAVCQMATRAIAGMIAGAVNAGADDVFKEISENLLPNSHLVPAGIVAVARAQERGYALVHAV